MIDAGEWLISTSKRNPEALLVLAAGCALLFRGGGSSGRAFAASSTGSASDGEWNVSRTAQTSDGVGDLKERIVEAGSSVVGRATEMTRNLSAQSRQFADQAQSTLTNSFGQLLREQPLALVAAGLAVGATVAALLPATELEERTFGDARDTVAGMAGKAVESAKDASLELGRGLADRASQGVKELAQGVAERVAEEVTGGSDKSSGHGNVSPMPNRSA